MTNDELEPTENGEPGSPEFGERLQAARERAGMSQEEVERLTGFPVRSITRWENGHAYPSFDKVVRMATLYGASTDWIAGRTPIPVCIRPGAILVDDDVLSTLEKLVNDGKRVSDFPASLLRRPGVNVAMLVPKALSVFGPDAAASLEQRVRSLWQRLGGNS